MNLAVVRVSLVQGFLGLLRFTLDLCDQLFCFQFTCRESRIKIIRKLLLGVYQRNQRMSCVFNIKEFLELRFLSFNCLSQGSELSGLLRNRFKDGAHKQTEVLLQAVNGSFNAHYRNVSSSLYCERGCLRFYFALDIQLSGLGRFQCCLCFVIRIQNRLFRVLNCRFAHLLTGLLLLYKFSSRCLLVSLAALATTS
ncbi:hypothetical protein D3C81_1538820 [compost metagenome]